MSTLYFSLALIMKELRCNFPSILPRFGISVFNGSYKLLLIKTK